MTAGIHRGQSHQVQKHVLRSGKTSVLFQILGGRLGGTFLPILIDMQMLAGIKGDREFFSAILKAGFAALGDPGLSLERLESEPGSTVERMFESFLESTRAGAPERIEAKIRDGSLSEAAVHYLAGILESPYRVSFVFTGSTNLEDRKAEVWKSLLGKSIYRKISYLSEKDTKRLLTEPLKEGHVREPRDLRFSLLQHLLGPARRAARQGGGPRAASPSRLLSRRFSARAGCTPSSCRLPALRGTSTWRPKGGAPRTMRVSQRPARSPMASARRRGRTSSSSWRTWEAMRRPRSPRACETGESRRMTLAPRSWKRKATLRARAKNWSPSAESSRGSSRNTSIG